MSTGKKWSLTWIGASLESMLESRHSPGRALAVGRAQPQVGQGQAQGSGVSAHAVTGRRLDERDDVFHRLGEKRKHLRGGCPPPTQQYQLITYCTARTATGARGVTPRNTREISVPELVVINAKCACVSACGSTAAELHVRGVQHGAEWCPVIWCADALSQHSQHAWPRGPLRGSGPRPPGG